MSPATTVSSILTSPVDYVVTEASADSLSSTYPEFVQKLSHAIPGGRSRDDAITGLLDVLCQTIDVAAILYCRRNSRNEVMPVSGVLPIASPVQNDGFQESLRNSCSVACETGCLHVATVEPTCRLRIIAVPVPLRNAPAEAISILVSSSLPTERVLGMLALVASHICLRESYDDSQSNASEAMGHAALIELLSKLDDAQSLTQGSAILGNQLRNFFQCQQVVIGLASFPGGDCHVTSVSGLPTFDRRTGFATAMEAALDEVALKNSLTVWPPQDDRERTASLALQRACEVLHASAVISAPIHDESGSVVGAWLFFGEPGFAFADSTRNFLLASQRPVGSHLKLLRRATETAWKRLARRSFCHLRTLKSKIAVVSACFLLALLLFPVPYKIRCDCHVQPIVRRFVAAPYDGKLEKTFVEPGDEVRLGDVVAKLDGRELRWELAGLEAEFGAARKRRESAMAVDDIADAQQAAYEMERFALKMDLIRDRLKNLEVRSPLTGIVISGDLRKAEGAPLAIGQTLFQIAPLDCMVVEVDIPEREIQYVRQGQLLEFRMDAYPQKTWVGEIARIFPKTEIRDIHSVYVAEVELDNQASELRPGMKGQAKIRGDRHAFGWNIFHKPYESFCMFVGW